jgi:exopolysaccharide biosynthesis protein
MRTTTFLRRSGAALAINASQFRPVEQEEFAPKDVAGVAIFEGEQYSDDEGNQAVIAFHGDTATIAEGPAGVEARHSDGAAPVVTAVAGRPIVLEEGRVRQFGPARHPRTAVGVDGPGETLLVLVAEGRMASRSIGLTLYEVGAWLRHLGAVDGLNLDGGGSSALVIRGSDGTPERVNRTVHNPIFGSERVVANHLGVRVEE